MDEEQSNEIALRKETLAAERQRMRESVQQKYRTVVAGGPKFTGVEFGLWLGASIIADIFSLIPYLGAPVGWAFNGALGLFKVAKGLNVKRSVIIAVIAMILETLLSTLPACIAAVVITYFMDKAKLIDKKVAPKIPVAGKTLSEAI